MPGARQSRAGLLPQVGISGRYGYEWRERSGDSAFEEGGSDSYGASASAEAIRRDPTKP